MSIENITLRELANLENVIPALAGFASRILAETYEDFIDVLYRDIDTIINLKQENPEHYQSDTKEDRFTVEIKNQLVGMGYNASHDTQIGGHADLVVKKNSFTWIGEAKIHKEYDYLWEGFQQLSTRYSIGDSNQKDGGLLIYIFGSNAKSVMQKWQDHLATKNLQNYSAEPCPKRALAFFSTHIHSRSGEIFRVRHMPIILYFAPQDKSGRNRKNR